MTSTENLDGVMRRIQKLLAIAQDARANQAEASAAAAMAERVMRKYQIDNVDAMRADVKQRENFAHMDCMAIMKRDVKGKGAHRPTKVPPWSGWLAYSVAKLNDCEIRYVRTDAGAVIRFFGFKADVQVAAWTFDYLVGQLIGSLRAHQRVDTRTKADSEAYRRGFILAVCGLVDRAKREKDAEMAAEVRSRALVVVKSAAVAEHFGAFTYRTGAIVKVNGRSDAYAAGREAGAKVELRQAVTHATDAPKTYLN